MKSFQCTVGALALLNSLGSLGCALPLHAQTVPAKRSTAAGTNLAQIHAQFVAKDEVIATLRQQLATQAALIAHTKNQAAFQKQEISQNQAAPSPATVPVPSLTAGIAPPRVAVNVSVAQPATPVVDVLAALSKQAGVPILADDTVVATVNTLTINHPSLEPALNQLKASVPGLNWQKVYVPREGVQPKANALSEQVRELKALTSKNLIIKDPDVQTLVSVSQRKESTVFPTPEGMILVYLVTNEAVRSQRFASEKTANAAQNNSGPLPTGQGAAASPAGLQAVTALKNTTDLLEQMTPDEQRQALPLMFQQFSQMIKKIDPNVMRELVQMRQQFQMGQ